VILKLPKLVKSEVGMVAVRFVEFTKVVVSEEPFHFTVDDPETKFVPLTVKVKLDEPEAIEVGLMEVIVGAAA